MQITWASRRFHLSIGTEGVIHSTMPDRRDAVPFDPDYFARRAAAGDAVAPVDAFRHAYATNFWAGPESRSGPGSSLDQTAVVRAVVPELCRSLSVGTLLDLPCGDHRWMAQVALDDVQYIGGDLLPELIDADTAQFGTTRRRFAVLDLTTSPLPAADLVLCRDCLVHLSFADIARAVANLQRAGITWLLTTTFPQQASNIDIRTGDWRPLNFEAAPFHWPAPDLVVNEQCTEGNGVFADKSLALWRVASLPLTPR
jgi:hypothetical protein